MPWANAGLLLTILFTLTGCATRSDPHKGLPMVAETWISVSTPTDEIDSVAGWSSPEGKLLVLASAKASDQLRVYDGDDGRYLRSIGSSGSGPGELKRPNGVFVAGNLAFVVERDNHRVQVFDLDSAQSIGHFGGEALRYPYGLWIWPQAQSDGVDSYWVYVTDSYYTDDGQVPPDVELGQRVKVFDVRRDGDGAVTGRLLTTFGATSGDGVLKTVESIWGDPAHDRLLVADENADRKDIKVYDLSGRFTGTVIGHGLFDNEPEGIALIDCGADSGYWLVSDQHNPDQAFRLFDRQSLSHVASFAPKQARTVDGIWFQPGAFGPLAGGALLSQHDDAAVVALAWRDIAATLSLRDGCGG